MASKTVLTPTATKTVGEMMTAPPLTVTAETPLKDAVQLLATHRISGLPVVNGDGEVIAEISEMLYKIINIYKKFPAEGDSVSNIMVIDSLE